MRSSALALTAAAVLALEGAALMVFVVIDLVGLLAGEAASLPTAIALTVLTLIGVVALFAFAAGTARGHTWARSGGVVLQVLALALALASLTVQPVVWAFALGVGVPALAGLVLLIASARRDPRGRGAE
ncbi:protein-S-isoprenylcysteine O-methyltransferase Ste14 [Microbacterium ginsengiterrae]|uniref:Protein-S-isoprenylcysteine O-methyltransferase Ste14 n=1 Tax=Microbacterium ginsengiterrae TaxID=546115 RepID=A0A7W9CDS9_9MICO|nr:hypothetical protein [Microbacterium paludicola]MBB5743782.1 protein-S-isoprenylcysteine O-methyltransferase Ste14 [Microbacterium ginsengiterrae]